MRGNCRSEGKFEESGEQRPPDSRLCFDDLTSRSKVSNTEDESNVGRARKRVLRLRDQTRPTLKKVSQVEQRKTSWNLFGSLLTRDRQEGYI